jgi:hypothetical protein
LGFASFATLDLDAFLKREAAPEELWVFVHIPKTAGSSFAAEWSTLRKPYRNIHVDYEDAETPYDVKLERAVDQFIADARTTPFRACSGHITMQHVLKIRKTIPGARAISFLRDPVERVISDFRYACTPAHPPYKEFIRQFPTIDAYVDSSASQNKMLKFLTPDPRLPITELLAFLDRSLSFIGLTEMYPMSFNILMQLTGSNQLPTLHKSKTEPTEFNNVERSPGLLKRIREANEHDLALFAFVKERMIARREQWRASLKTAAHAAGEGAAQPAGGS